MTRAGIDPLTGLAGAPRLWRSLMTAGEDHALLLVDLDGFHAHNISAGFDAGDRVLRTVASVLADNVRDGTVLRLSADEFGLVVRCDGPESAIERAHAVVAMLAALVPPWSACCGAAMVVVGSSGRVAVRTSVERAGLALQSARRSGPGSVAGVRTDGRSLSALEQEDLEVRTALRLGDYELFFQPIMVPATSRPVGLEALVRWRRDAAEVLSPGVFLPQVRRSGIAAEFGAGLIMDALSGWTGGLRAGVLGASGDGMRVPMLAVNVDVEQVEQDGFDALVLHLLRRAAVPPTELVIEVTESVLAETSALEHLRRLSHAGVHVAIDDFGAGPIVLSEIRELPVSLIKVDQVLVGRLDPAHPDLGLIGDLHRLADLLGLRLAVEAVETAPLAERIAELGVPLAQGYHYARPMPGGEALDWLQARVVPGAATPGGTGGAGVAAPDV